MGTDKIRAALPEGALELRTVPVGETRATLDDAQPRITGLGSPYGVATTITSWWDEWDEVVAPGAWAKTLAAGGNIRSMLNHNPDRLLGTTAAGTLRLSEDEEGLHYEIDVNLDDSYAMSVFAQVERGDINGASVWFRVISQTWTEPTDKNGMERPLRTITEAELFEVGPVVFPAFESTTSAAARSLDRILATAGLGPRRAAVTADLLAGDPDQVEARIRDLFARNPNLRAATCGRSTSAESATVTPPTGSSRSQLVAAINRYLDLVVETI